MREYKFRVYSQINRIMYTQEMDKEIKNLWAIPKAQGGLLNYPDGVLMQYTGLKDKNGVEIYEGDICEIRYLNGESTVRGVVKWLQTHTHFSLVTRKGTYSIGMTGSIVDGIYIIGDLFTTPWENPVLLEEK